MTYSARTVVPARHVSLCALSKYPFNYYAKVARQKGVPDMWIEDAVQDMLLQMWLTGDTEEKGIKHRAVDAMRKYGPHKQGGRNGYVYTGPSFTGLDDAENAVGAAKQREYDQQVRTAEAARDRELSRDRRFSDTATGKLFEATGGFAPMAFGAATGALSRVATGGGKMGDYVLPAGLGTLAGAGSANVPLAYNTLYTEPDNPMKRAFEALLRSRGNHRRFRFQQMKTHREEPGPYV